MVSGIFNGKSGNACNRSPSRIQHSILTTMAPFGTGVQDLSRKFAGDGESLLNLHHWRFE